MEWRKDTQNLTGLRSGMYLRGADGKDEYDKKYTVRTTTTTNNNRDRRRWGEKQMLKQPKSEMYRLLKLHTCSFGTNVVNCHSSFQLSQALGEVRHRPKFWQKHFFFGPIVPLFLFDSFSSENWVLDLTHTCWADLLPWNHMSSCTRMTKYVISLSGERYHSAAPDASNARKGDIYLDAGTDMYPETYSFAVQG